MCQTKVCTNCKEEKDLECFVKSKRTRDKRQTQCKDCVNFKKRLRNSNRVVQEYNENDMKTCTDCKIEKPFLCFSKSVDTLDGKMKQCKSCRRKYYTLKREGVIIFSEDKQRICTKCGILKNFSDFNKNSKTNHGVTSVCKVCQKQNRELQKNKEKEIPYFKICTKCNIEKCKSFFVKDSSKRDGLSCICKPCSNAQRVERFKNDDMFRLTSSIRRNVIRAFKKCLNGMHTKHKKTEFIIQTSFFNFKNHIETQFENWMSWNKYGKYSGRLKHGFDVDHIIPISYAKTEEELYLLSHWSNFQPLCSKINRDVKKANIYPCTNLELGITFWEDRWEYITLP